MEDLMQAGLDRCGDDFRPDERNGQPLGEASPHHLMIGGTGRAGTTFLVRYLTEFGLDTELARRGEQAEVYPDANAGLENIPLPGPGADLPYVVKSPWLYECVDEILARGAMRMDGVIIPIRPLAEAAASRSIIEARGMYRSAPWMVEFDEAWETWCHTGGGTVFSINPIDQGRLLAVGLHTLLERLVAADIPVVLLAFPRMATDWRYLFRKLRRFLPASVDAEAARAVHLRVADLAKVRVGAELAAEQGAVGIVRHATPGQVDAIAVRREMASLRQRLSDREGVIADLSGQLAQLQARIVEGKMALQGGDGEKQTLLDALAASEAARQASEAHAAMVRAALEAMRRSRSWRLTRPYRAIGDRLRHLLGQSAGA